MEKLLVDRKNGKDIIVKVGDIGSEMCIRDRI